MEVVMHDRSFLTALVVPLLTIFGCGFLLLFGRVLTEPHQGAVGVLSRGDHVPSQRHAHGGSRVRFMSVQQGGAVHSADQIQTQEMLQRNCNAKHTSLVSLSTDKYIMHDPVKYNTFFPGFWGFCFNFSGFHFLIVK